MNHAKQSKNGAQFSSEKNTGRNMERRLAKELHDR